MIDFKEKTDKQIGEFIVKDNTYLRNDRQTFEGLWEIEAKIFSPRRHDLLVQSCSKNTKGRQYGMNIYDGHPANAANKFSMGLLAHMMSRTMPWIQFTTTNQQLMKDDNVKKYVQAAAEQVLFGLNESDIYGQSVWFTKDATVIGTGVNIPQENRKAGKMHYETVHPKDSWIRYDRFGNLVAYHRQVKLPAIEALEEFGESNLPKSIVRDAKGLGGANPFAESSFIYAWYRNETPVAGSLRSEDKKFKVFYVLVTGNSGPNSKKLVFKGGTDMEPNVWAYGREPGTHYGVSIAADALTEGLQGNKLGELMLTMVHREADPPTEAPRSMRSDGIRNKPGGRNWIPEKYVGHQAIREIFSNGNWPITDAQEQRLHDSIDDKFFVPLWDALMTMKGPQRTATEVLQIQGNKAVLLSPVSVDFEDMYLRRVVDNQWIFEEQIANRMPPVPDILLEPKNRKIETGFIGPLNQLQKATMQTRGTINALAVIDNIRSIWPTSIIKINELELMEEAAISQGMKQTLIKSDEEVREILEAQAAKAAAAEQAQMMIEGAKTIPGLGKEIEPNSALELAGAEI